MTTPKNIISAEEVARDVEAILWSARICNVYRYTHQRFWEKETRELEYALRIEGSPRLESVADHSWHLADIVLLIGHRFPPLDIAKCISLAVLHDKLEIIIDDKNPIGRDGTGKKTHAFNAEQRQKKDDLEREALRRYCKRLNEFARQNQLSLMEEMIQAQSREARFIKGLDKLHPLTFVLKKKDGDMINSHLQFTIKYSGTSLEYFPELKPYYDELVRRLICAVAEFRGVSTREVEQIVFTQQLELSFDGLET